MTVLDEKRRLFSMRILAYCVAMLVTVERLTKTYGNFKAVDDVSFVVQRGRNCWPGWSQWGRQNDHYSHDAGLDFAKRWHGAYVREEPGSGSRADTPAIEFHVAIHGIPGAA